MMEQQYPTGGVWAAQCVDLTRTFEEPPSGFDVPQFFVATLSENELGEPEVVFVGNPPIEVIDCLAEVRNAREHAFAFVDEAFDAQYPEVMARRASLSQIPRRRAYFRKQIRQAQAERKAAEAAHHKCSTEVRNAQVAENMAEEALLRFNRELNRLDRELSADEPATDEHLTGDGRQRAIAEQLHPNLEPLDETQQGCANEIMGAHSR